MKKTQISVLVGVSVSLVALLMVTSVYPYVDDLLIENPFWNGLSLFYSELGPERLGMLSRLEGYGMGCTLFIIGPDSGFSVSDVMAVSDFLEGGGRVVLADDFGSGNELLESLGVSVRFDGRQVVDPVFREKNMVLPRVRGDHYDIDYIVMNYPTFLTDRSGSLVVWSSPLSIARSSGDGYGVVGEYGVVAEIRVGDGLLVLLSDSSVFINSMIDLGGNREFRDVLVVGKLFIDESHTDYTVMGSLKQSLAKAYTFLGFYEIRYALTALGIIVILGVRLNVSESPVDPVEELMQRHPEYDRAQLVWLEEQRRNQYGS